LTKASDLVDDQFPEIDMAIATVTNTFSGAVTFVGLISGLAMSALSPVLGTLTPLVNKLGACAASIDGL
jgi:hypothetical protein